MKVRARDILLVYWKEVKRYKLLLVLMVFFIVGAKIVQLTIPLYYKRFFDTLAVDHPSLTSNNELLGIILSILVLNIITWVGWRFASFLNTLFQPHVISDLTQSGFSYLIGHSYGFFTNSFVGALTRRVRRLGDSFERFADSVYWILVPLVVRIISTTIVLWTVNHTIALVLIAWIILFLALNYFFSIWKLKYDTLLASQDSESTAVLSDSITNHTNLFLFNGISSEVTGFKVVSERLRKLATFNWTLDAVVEAVQTALMIAVEFLLFYFAIKYWQQGLLSIGTFVLIQAYLLGLIGDLWDFGRSIRNIYRSFADAEETVDMLKTPHEIQDIPKAKPLVINEGKIEFQKATFSFNQTRRVLNRFNLLIKPGEKVALVGPSGAGKSTIVKMIFRFYDLDSGKILIDDQNIARVTQESLRESLSLVPQDPLLFHRSIMENIRYGRREATDQEVIEASKLANCHEFVKDLSDAYNTMVGERGVKLSGGERQRVAIARAILKNAPILVLDEATSSLDSESESLIQEALERLMEGKTTIVIAHRLSTIRRMDRIIVIDGGAVAEEGTHDTLVRKSKSLYRKLWKLQAGGFLQDE